eukprot:TRINITY_DN22085_c0_g1_i1.p2 TRINITY_DN22085_c0_g1~~TRINITY_DN22085_c0_g1_i1.p2  ORF type:complete len:328 (+),score=105.24 TRINITY_DN22085_c0_g1_i1:65-1048(+)
MDNESGSGDTHCEMAAVGRRASMNRVAVVTIPTNSVPSAGPPLSPYSMSKAHVAPLQQLLLDPVTTMDTIVETGGVRASRVWWRILLSSILGGVYLSFGGAFSIFVGAGAGGVRDESPHLASLLSALVFPMGLGIILLGGVDLLTSNMVYVSLPFLTHPHREVKTKLLDFVKVLGMSFFGNFLGSLLAAWYFDAVVWGSGHLASEAAKRIAVNKTTQGFGIAFGKAVGANWLVNIAVFQATTATSTLGKLSAIWMPITAFVAMGLEHVVANMFSIPCGMLAGADVSVGDLLGQNIAPVLLGNYVGGVLGVGCLQWAALEGYARRKAE